MTKIIQDPFKTTVKGTGSTANVAVTIKRIQNKICVYGICSDKEQEFFERYTSGKIDQKEPFTG